jgi:hypothetical protein
VGDVAGISEVHAASIFSVKDNEDGGCMQLQTVGNITHNHMKQQPKNEISVKKYMVCKLCSLFSVVYNDCQNITDQKNSENFPQQTATISSLREKKVAMSVFSK